MEEQETEDENVDYEPSVDSPNPEERKLARQLRIQKRQDAIKKQQAAVQPSSLYVMPETDKTDPIPAQLEESNDILFNLTVEADDYVTNVKVANYSREVERREKENLKKFKIYEEINNEAQVAQEMFDEISDKWIEILKYNDPLHIHEDIILQKYKCDEVIRQKDGIIAMLKNEIKKAELNFTADQVKQMDDINSLVQRIEKQINLMRRAYRQELEIIEDVLLSERQNCLDSNDKKWEELYKKRDQEEQTNYQDKDDALEDFIKETRKIRINFQEHYRATKIRMEREVGELQKELERIKTLALLNGEKLDYNYQILKKRADENLIMKSQQKRRINKLQDQITLLKDEIQSNYEEFLASSSKMREEIEKTQKNILDIDLKADHFAKIDDAKFNQIWYMNTERADKLVNKIMSIDQILHEQHLGLKWERPENEILKREDLVSYKLAMKIIRNTIRTNKKDEKCLYNQDIEIEPKEGKHYNDLVKQVLELISKKCDFLIEDELETILEPYMKKDRHLVRLDNVFTALNIENKDNIELLMQFFIPYTFCEVCSMKSNKKSSLVIPTEGVQSVEETVDEKNDSFADEYLLNETDVEDNKSIYSIQSDTPLKLYDDCEDECYMMTHEIPLEVVSSETSSTLSKLETMKEIDKDVCIREHKLMISPVFILKALKEFMGKFYEKKQSIPTMAKRLASKRPTVARILTNEDIELFWARYQQCFPKENEQIWDGLTQGLKRYLDLLKERKNVSEEILLYRRQNQELKNLLEYYLNVEYKRKIMNE